MKKILFLFAAGTLFLAQGAAAQMDGDMMQQMGPEAQEQMQEMMERMAEGSLAEDEQKEMHAMMQMMCPMMMVE